MHVNFVRRFPLSMLFGMTIAGVVVAAPLGQNDHVKERLTLIVESELHGIGASGSSFAEKPDLPSSARGSQSLAPGADPDPSLAGSKQPLSADVSADAVDGNGRGGGNVARQSQADEGTAGQPASALQAWAAVPAHELDDMRGGFDTSLNLTLSFGIERAVYLNGALVTTTSFNLPALGSLSHDEATNAIVPAGSVALVQSGPGNTFVPARDATPLAATVIQNTLNNQSLQSLTTINAASNSLQILRTNTFQSMLEDKSSVATRL